MAKARAADRKRNQQPERKAYLGRKAKEWAENNPAERRAQVAVGNAVRDGRLDKGTVCEQADGNCSGPINAHHDDYSKPLEVRWLCRSHHMKWHAANGPGKR
jgi:hypothetical protein